MAIENVEQKCYNREGTKAAVKHNLPGTAKPKNFDKLEKSGEYAKRQLIAIKYYMNDYDCIINNIKDNDKEVRDYIDKLNEKSELIWRKNNKV